VIRWAIDLLLGLLARWRGEADAARMEAQVERMRREAAQARAEADEAVRRADDAMERLRRDWRKPGAGLAAFCVIAMSVTACAPSPALVQAVDTGCDWARPIYVSDLDQFTDATARAVLAHNEVWRKRCGGKQ
jgi:hypothetical protein